MESVILIDVNILVYAHRPDAVDHTRYLGWLKDSLNSGEVCGLSELALAGMVRIVTHPQIYPKPSPIDLALKFAQELRDDEGSAIVSPGPRHWNLFEDLCRASGAKGNLVSDAYFAALAIESGAEWITADRDFSRFPGLRWRHPLS
jgi:toxin-antitoxin system PIN domain toxin